MQNCTESETNLQVIPEEAFKETQQLKHVDLFENFNLIIDNYEPFKYLKGLEFLDIARCSQVVQFINIPMPKLKKLVIYESQVRVLP